MPVDKTVALIFVVGIVTGLSIVGMVILVLWGCP